MFFVLDLDGKKIVMMAASLAKLNQLCSDHAVRRVVATMHGGILSESQFATLLASPNDYTMIEISNAPSLSAAVTQTQIINPKVERMESQPVLRAESTPTAAPPAPEAPQLLATGLSEKKSLTTHDIITVGNVNAGAQRFLEIRKSEAREEAIRASEKLAAERRATLIAAPPSVVSHDRSAAPEVRVASGAPESRAAAPLVRSAAPEVSHEPARLEVTRVPANPTREQSNDASVSDKGLREVLTADDVVRFATFVDIRLEVLSRISIHGVAFGNSNYLHFIRSDTKEMIITSRDYDALRSNLLMRLDTHVWNPLEVVAVWRIDGKVLDTPTESSQRTGPEPFVETPVREAPRSSLVSEVVGGGSRFRGQIKLCVHGVGVLGYIPFDRHFPPSFWLLVQHVAHLSGIPPHMVEIDVTCNHIPEVLVVQTDFDVRAVAHMMNTSEPTLFAVDLRL